MLQQHKLEFCIDKAFFLAFILWLASSCKDKETIPQLTTLPVTSITSTGAQSGGDITEDGGFAVLERGVCWSTNPNPTKDLISSTSDGEGIGTYSSTITGLSPGMVYYVRAYATNALGTAYGDELTFSAGAVLPVLTTKTIPFSSIISTSTARGGGDISYDGGGPIIARGVCWSSTDSKPTIALSTKTMDGEGVGSFSSILTNLSLDTYYYVRAYATNSAGTAYGDISWEQCCQNGQPVRFTETYGFWMPGPPTIVGSYLDSNVGTNYSILEVQANDHYLLDEVGACWDIVPDPTIDDNAVKLEGPPSTYNGKVSLGGNIRIPNLNPGTTYYIRGYAKNQFGVVYGPQFSFSTRVEECCLHIADNWQGGVIAHLLDNGYQGLILSNGVQASMPWGCIGTLEGHTISSLGAGEGNTKYIVAGCGEGAIAAKTCADLSLNYYNDWFLPSKDELNLIYQNLIESSYPGTEPYKSSLKGIYWTSTEDSSQFAWAQDFSTGEQIKVAKATSLTFLPIRYMKNSYRGE